MNPYLSIYFVSPSMSFFLYDKMFFFFSKSRYYCHCHCNLFRVPLSVILLVTCMEVLDL